VLNRFNILHYSIVIFKIIFIYIFTLAPCRILPM